MKPLFVMLNKRGSYYSKPLYNEPNKDCSLGMRGAEVIEGSISLF